MSKGSRNRTSDFDRFRRNFDYMRRHGHKNALKCPTAEKACPDKAPAPPVNPRASLTPSGHVLVIKRGEGPGGSALQTRNCPKT
jgi:hypothetical protein